MIHLKKYIIGSLFFIFLFSISVMIRIPDILSGKGIENIQATYHVMLTVDAIKENNISHHYFLPITTLGGKENKNIPWGAAVPNGKGDFIYTSFPSLGFIAPHLFLSIVNIENTIFSISVFNIFIQFLTCIIMLFFLIKLIEKKDRDDKKTALIITISLLPFIFSREALVSSGLVYWPQSLSQLIISLLFLFLLLYKRGHTKSIIMICFLITAFTLTEWTSVVFSGIFSAYLWLSKEHRDRKMSVFIILSCSIGLLIYFIQFAAVVDVKNFLLTSASRFKARSGENADYLLLTYGYFRSFGLFLLIVPVYILSKKYRIKNSELNFFIFLSITLLIENIILAQHATSFTFDRLKLTFLLSILLASFLAEKKNNILFLSAIFLILSSYLSIFSYKLDIKKFPDWGKINDKNTEIALKLKSETSSKCVKLYSETRVRAYLNLLLHRSVHEGLPTSIKDEQENNDCYIALIKGEMIEPDLQKINKIEIHDTNGKILIIN